VAQPRVIWAAMFAPVDTPSSTEQAGGTIRILCLQEPAISSAAPRSSAIILRLLASMKKLLPV
jgi:hypothetical protein